MELKVILGLGNPGREYEATRHNVGWWVLDHLADVWHFDGWRKDGEAVVSNGTVGPHKVRLVKPQGYYNLSGNALRPYLRRPFWSAKTDLLVVCDDVALPIGRFRIRPQGSAGGSNGLKSVEAALKSQEYPRLRVGTGPPPDQQREVGRLSDYVLSPMGKLDRQIVHELTPRVADACETWVREGVIAAMNKHNGNNA